MLLRQRDRITCIFGESFLEIREVDFRDIEDEKQERGGEGRSGLYTHTSPGARVLARALRTKAPGAHDVCGRGDWLSAGGWVKR